MFLYLLGLVAFLFLYRWYRERDRVGNENDKYVYITGCDSGFGNALAKHLDKMGYRVMASCFTEKGEDELRKACSERLTAFHLDVSNTESVNKAAEFIKNHVGEKGEQTAQPPYVQWKEERSQYRKCYCGQTVPQLGVALHTVSHGPPLLII